MCVALNGRIIYQIEGALFQSPSFPAGGIGAGGIETCSLISYCCPLAAWTHRPAIWVPYEKYPSGKLAGGTKHQMVYIYIYIYIVVAQ